MGQYQIVNGMVDLLGKGKVAVQDMAGILMHDGTILTNMGKNLARHELTKGEQIISNISQKSFYQMGQEAMDAAKNTVNYFGRTPVGEIAADGRGIVTNSMEYKVASQQLQKAGNYGKTLLGDADNFLHNADGSYNRWKVGGAIGAGLGIAGIIGYNANN